ncbi:MAG TPA: orotidine-5'-phosphate decarboxylase [Candidatus Limnocylindria bacterium]|nr:orotidine-5'-phosphate decarboxylase [Candidatus Limnocylindria bacterium]
MTEAPAASAAERLRARVAAIGAPLCVGIDPNPTELPAGLPPDATGVERFARGLLEATLAVAAAIKINVAFFEAFGSAGWAALERLRGDVPPGVPCILDAKRGDIGSTAERYATALMDLLDADAVTLSPYLGEDAIEPFLAYPGRMVWVVCRTSNPDAGRLQQLRVDGRPLHAVVAGWVAGTWPPDRAGLVVGATAPDEMLMLRALAPEHPFLVPGVGAQGGDLDAAVRLCHGRATPGLVAVSRGIARPAAAASNGWQAAAARAARELSDRMQTAGGRLVDEPTRLHEPPHAADTGG